MVKLSGFRSASFHDRSSSVPTWRHGLTGLQHRKAPFGGREGNDRRRATGHRRDLPPSDRSDKAAAVVRRAEDIPAHHAGMRADQAMLRQADGLVRRRGIRSAPPPAPEEDRTRSRTASAPPP